MFFGFFFFFLNILLHGLLLAYSVRRLNKVTLHKDYNKYVRIVVILLLVTFVNNVATFLDVVSILSTREGGG